MLSLRISTVFKFCSTRQLNYYRILDLKPGSTLEVIKNKYYQLAKIHHPDTNSDPQSLKKFLRINEAYQTLSDHRKRKIYDDSFDFKSNEEELYRHKNKKHTSRKEAQFSEPFNEHDEFFKKGGTRTKPKRGEDIYQKVTVSLQQAVKGLSKKFFVKRTVVCIDCDPTSLPKCFSCGGKGKIHIYSTRKDEECSKCKGKGYKNNCDTCSDEGVMSETCEQEIYIPKGVANQTVLRKQGSGGYGMRHKNGDLYVKVLIEKDEYYTVDGSNVRTTNFIPISIAVLGGSINVETLHGPVEVTLEPGTQSGDERRLPNHGLPSLYSQRTGDQILSFRIQIPKEVEETHRQIFKQLARS